MTPQGRGVPTPAPSAAPVIPGRGAPPPGLMTAPPGMIPGMPGAMQMGRGLTKRNLCTQRAFIQSFLCCRTASFRSTTNGATHASTAAPRHAPPGNGATTSLTSLTLHSPQDSIFEIAIIYGLSKWGTILFRVNQTYGSEPNSDQNSLK